jgi:type III pantothenate kinase
MIIAVDLGNTAIKLGLYHQHQLIQRFVTHTNKVKSISEYIISFQSFIGGVPSFSEKIEGIILCSVVPTLTTVVKQALEAVFKTKVFLVGKGIKTGLQISIDNPSELGTDLVADAVGGIVKYGKPLIIVDMGTATKVIAVDKNGTFSGVVIAPGLMISMEALVGRTSQLMEVSLEVPSKVIGKNTADSINSGILYGNAELVLGVTKRIENELLITGCKKILTGGYAHYLEPLLKEYFVFDESLALDGLIDIYFRNGEKK